MLAKAAYFLHSNNDALVTIRARNTIPCILYTLSKLFGIIFSFDPTQLQYTSACGKYIIKASDEGSTSFQIWSRLNVSGLNESDMAYSDRDIVSPASQSVDLAQAINSSFFGPEIIKENVILAVNANFIQVFKLMQVAWYENLDTDTPRRIYLPDPDSNVTLSKLFASDDSFGETYSKMKAEWDVDISIVALNSADGLGLDDMFSVERFLPKGPLERLKRSCGCSDCSCGSNNASAEDCMTRAVFHWTIRRTMAMIATLFFVGKTPFRVFNRFEVDNLHLSDACRRMSIALRCAPPSSLGLSQVNSHSTSRIERGDVVAVQCLKEMALRLLTGDRNADVGLDFQGSALMRTIRGRTTYEAWIASGGLDMRRLLGYDVFPGAIHVDNIGTVPSLHPSDWNSVQKSRPGDLITILEADGIGRPQSITSFVPLASIKDGECAASFKFVRGSQMALIRAGDIRRLPAYLVFERHHEHKCARAWKEEKWWDGVSDPPLGSRCVSKTYGDTIAQLCAATIAVKRASSFSPSSVVVQGSGCLKCAMHHASVDLVIT